MLKLKDYTCKLADITSWYNTSSQSVKLKSYDGSNTAILTREEMNAIMLEIDKRKKSSQNFIGKGKVAFYKSNFPSSMLNRHNTGFSRTNKYDKADYIVTDYQILKSGTINYVVDSNTNTIIIKKFAHTAFDLFFKDVEFETGYLIFDANLAELYLNSNYSAKIIYDADFITAIIPQLPKLTEEQLETIKSLVQSDSSENINLAINTLAECNLQGNYVEIAKMFNSYLLKKVKKSTSLDFLLYQFDITPTHCEDLKHVQGYCYFNKPWMTQEDKDLAKAMYIDRFINELSYSQQKFLRESNLKLLFIDDEKN